MFFKKVDFCFQSSGSRSNADQYGFSLVEVLVAAVLLGLLAVGSMGLIRDGYTYLGRSEDAQERSAAGNYLLQFVDCEKTMADPSYATSCLNNQPITLRDSSNNVILEPTGRTFDDVTVFNRCDAGEIYLDATSDIRPSLVELLGGVPIICRPPLENLQNPIAMTMTFASAGKSLAINLTLIAKNTIKEASGREVTEMEVDPTTLSAEISGDFSKDLRDQFLRGVIKATVIYDPTKRAEERYSITVTLTVKNLKVNGVDKGDQIITMSKSGKTLNLENNEGDVKALEDSQTKESQCKIKKNGNQPHKGVYSVVLTQGAPCEFQISSLQITGVGGTFKVPTGATWIYKGTWGKDKTLRVSRQKPAHALPISKNLNWKTARGFSREIFIDEKLKTSKDIPLGVDNGFLLAQPDGNVYLLADAGLSAQSDSDYKTTESIARDLVFSLKAGAKSLFKGAGKVKLLKPTADQVFQKGSVIAIYDDTPDMGGSINVEALTKYVVTANTNLSWKTEGRESPAR